MVHTVPTAAMPESNNRLKFRRVGPNQMVMTDERSAEGFTTRVPRPAPGAPSRPGATVEGPGPVFPQRPTWNPVEEARRRAELEARAAAAALPPSPAKRRSRGRQQDAPLAVAEAVAVAEPAPAPIGPGYLPSARTQFAPGANPFVQRGNPPSRPPELPPRLLHTTTPRLLASVAPLLGLMAVIFFVVLRRRGYITETTHYDAGGEVTDYHLDPTMRSRAALVGVAGFVLPVLAWCWWTVSAGLNARAKSRSAGSPWTLPVSLLVVLVAASLIRVLPSSLDGMKVVLVIVILAAYVFATYGVLFSVRKSARAIRADSDPWTRLLWIPWASSGISFAALVVAGATGVATIALVALLVPLGLSLWAWASLCMGMDSFDRACRAREESRAELDALPAFMTGNRLAP